MDAKQGRPYPEFQVGALLRNTGVLCTPRGCRWDAVITEADTMPKCARVTQVYCLLGPNQQCYVALYAWAACVAAPGAAAGPQNVASGGQRG